MKDDMTGVKRTDHAQTRPSKSAGLDQSTVAPKPGRLSIFQAFMQNQVSLRNYISRFVVTAHEIDDVSQETFLRAYKAEKNTVIEQPKAFLFRVAKNMMLSEFSNKSRKMIDYVEDFEQSNLQVHTQDLEDNVIAQQKLGAYCEAVASLPLRCRQVVLMKKVYGMSYKEIARRLDISVSAVEKHLVKGGRRCEQIMAERYFEETDYSSKQSEPQLTLVPSRREQ